MKRFIIVFVFALFCMGSYAQFDNNLMQMLEQTMQYADRAMKENNERYEQIMENTRKNMTATAVILPSGKTDIYKALITISTTLGLNDLIIEYVPGEEDVFSYQPIGKFKRVNLENCVVIGNYVWLPDILRPGHILRLRKVGSSKELYSCYIPSKESSDYVSFKMKASENLSILSAMFSGNSYSTYPSSSYSNSSDHTGSSNHQPSTCSMCNGKGWIKGNSTPTYGNMDTHWCSDCGEQVSASHSHDICPSCGGKGSR